MRFALVNLGCKVNRVESDSIAAALLAQGWESVDACADVAIINTCTVTAEADRKTRKEVNRALSRNPDAQVVATGCAAVIDPGQLTCLSERVVVVPKQAVVEHCLGLAGPHECASFPPSGRVGEGFATRVGIKAQDGCDNACTFCIVHVARGPATSVPLAHLVRQVEDLDGRGVREVVLTGIDLGSYRSADARLPELVRALRQAAPDVRLRISSIEPNTIDDALIEILATEDGMVCRHLHIPMQSGSTKVLSQMARRYTADEYLRVVERVRELVPQVSLSTDGIVGFPGETDADFDQTVALARTCGFSRMHVFRYSKRAGTPAAQRSDQIEPALSAHRARTLSALAARMRLEQARLRVGTTERVLVEDGRMGTSESYYQVHVGEKPARGDLIEVALASVGEDGVFGL